MIRGRAYDPVKRAIDVVGAGALLVITAPVQLLIAALVRVKLGSPVLFRQERPGKDSAVFELLKFRTMRDALPGEDPHSTSRITPLGHVLRTTSLDELPSLVNVLRGQMSLVGPRPLLVSYLDRYNEHQARRHEVRPGVTGWAQVSGRNALTWTDKLALDVEYVDARSLGLDIRILARTVAAVFRRADVDAAAETTMPEFRGGGRDA